jgi:hypothetical protein
MTSRGAGSLLDPDRSTMNRKDQMTATTLTNTGGHHAVVDTTHTRPRRILMVVANPTVSTTTGWPVGFWAAELTHPYYEFTEAGFAVTIASPNGGKVEADALSDPREASRTNCRGVVNLLLSSFSASRSSASSPALQSSS